MAEDNNQDMAMEDILSSIKNILEEDEAGKAAAPVQAEEPLIDEQAEVNVDDILELSPDMRADEPPAPDAAPAAAEEIDLEAELDDIPAAALTEEPHFEIADSEADEKQGVQSNVNLGWEDFESDPFDADDKAVAAEDEAEAELASPEPAVAELPEEVSAVEAEPVVENEPVVEAEPVVKPEPVVEPAPRTPAEAKPAADAVDVSASIISNFTKMFSQAESQSRPEPEAAAVLPSEPVTVIGDGAKTIEDVISDVIRRIIGAEVEKNWRGQADYDTYAREVIAAQTKDWLDANLPAVVETIVKQEIERVMAKVGNTQ